MDVSIIIVNYNTCKLLQECLESIYRHTQGIDFEVIVSDNGSVDGSIEMMKKYPQVTLIENNANLGFGAANNRGLAVAKGKYIFYLNSDTVLLNNAVKIFYDYWEMSPERNKIGALGCNLLDEDGKVTHSYGNFPVYKTEVRWRLIQLSKLVIKRIIFLLGKTYTKKMLHTNSFYEGRVDYVTGADLFLKNNEFAKFDERFFLYYEETDLQLQLHQSGFYSMIIPGPEIQHLCNALNSQQNDILLMRSFSHIQSDISVVKYFQKHTNKKCFLLNMLIKLSWIISGVKR